MRSISPYAWVLAAVSAALQVAIFPVAGPLPVVMTALAWIALLPLLLALLLPSRNDAPLRVRAAAVLGYFCGVVWYAGNCSWIYQTMYLYGGLPKPVALLILFLFSLYLGLYHALFGACFALIRRSSLGRSGALAATPFLWVAVELARARVTGFPWDLLGNSQVSNLLVTRLAPFAGVMVISFLVAGLNACFVFALFSEGKRRLAQLSALLAIAVLIHLAGQSSFLAERDRAPELSHVVMMQENLAVGAAGHGSHSSSVAEELQIFQRASEHPLAPGPGTAPGVSPDLVVWPEAPSHFQSNDPAFQAELSNFATRIKTPVIAGSLGVDQAPAATRGYSLYDSASLFSADGKYAGRYDKIHLVPWGEYIPFKRFFSFAQKLTEGVGDMDPGQTRTVFQTAGHTYGVFICYESIFGDEVREFVKNGAEVLVNISDDGWYGDTGAPWQHLNMARMRAIENHRYLLRSTNTGVTTVIDPRGRVATEAPRHIQAAFVFPFAFESGQTLYTRFGDWFAYLCLAVTLGFLGFSLRRRMD